jgi:hypothetical protein
MLKSSPGADNPKKLFLNGFAKPALPAHTSPPKGVIDGLWGFGYQ